MIFPGMQDCLDSFKIYLFESQSGLLYDMGSISKGSEERNMVEQDYIMRLIKEMVRAVMKLLFGVESELSAREMVTLSEQGEIGERLLSMVDEGKINEAENSLFMVEENVDAPKLAVLFYSYLNDKDEAFLQANDYSREEIKQGLVDCLSRCGLGSVVDIFL